MKRIILVLLALSQFAATTQVAAQAQRQGAQRRPGAVSQAEMDEASAQFGKLSEVFGIMAGNYLDTVDYRGVVEKGIVAMLGQLDPHSVYLTAKERQVSQEELGGSFSGIGIEFNTLNDTVIVVGTIAGGPAERVGLMPNDRITGIDGASAIGISRTDVPKYLRGAKGTKVALEVFRRGVSGYLDFTVTRDDIPLNTIDAAYKIDDRTGYIKVNRFGATTGRELADAFAVLDGGTGYSGGGADSAGNGTGAIDGLILDLRGNGGGYLPEAIRMSEFFLDMGQRIVSTRGNMHRGRVYTAERTGRFAGGRLIVLVDEASASASEIVAGAVQDWDRGIVVGRPTFGKGLVQGEFPLEDGSAVRLTIAKYLTPTGRAIQRPYERGHSEEYYREHAARYGGGGLDTLAAGTAVADTVGGEYRTLRTGRPVYGGGGIRPDVMVASDTTGHSAYWSALFRRGLIHEFAQYYLDANRSHLAAEYRDVDSYLRGFDAAELLPQLAGYAAVHGVERDEEGLEISGGWLSVQLKAIIARRLWDATAFFRVTHASYDEVFRVARAMMLRWQDEPAMPPFAPVSDELVHRLTSPR